MPIIGAHVSAAGSLDKSLDRAFEIGAVCTQIFIAPPQQWATPVPSDQIVSIYKQKASELQIGPNFIHATYLVNLGTANPENLEKGRNWLIYSQKVAVQLGMIGTIFHIGSFKNSTYQQSLSQIIKTVTTIVEQVPAATLILENSAGAGNCIGNQFEEIADIIKGIGSKNIRVCLDTQHAFASGYDLRTKQAVTQTLEKFDQTIGLDKLIVIHCNDSKVEFGSNKDRHENIGSGLIGKDGFLHLINHPLLKHLPFILEVPGMAGTGPDKENIQILKSLTSGLSQIDLRGGDIPMA